MRNAAKALAILLAGLVTCAASADAAQNHKPQPATPANLAPPNLPVTGASLSVAGSRTPLWSLNGQADLPIASTTKMMTALVVLQRVRDLERIVAQADWRPDVDDSQIGLVPGERMTIHDLLVALLLPSADDAAEDLASNVGRGSVARFVGWMNADARTLGLRHTHFTTPIGLDTPGNYSSPDDLVRLADYMMRRWRFFRRTVRLPAATLASGRLRRHVVNTNDLLRTVPWIDGVKTGHTEDAGYVLVAEGHRHGFTLLSAVLGTSSEYKRDASTLALLDWGFSEFRVIRPVLPGETFARRRVPDEAAPAVIVVERGYRTVVPRTTRVRLRVGRLRRLAGPMAKGTVVGHLRIAIPGRRTVLVPLVLARRLPAVSALTKLGHVVMRTITLLILALLLGGAAVVVVRRRRPRVLALGRVEER